MPRESLIQIYRSTTASNAPSLTAGELAVNIPDKKLFVGGTSGNITFLDASAHVTTVNGLTGAINITGDGGSQLVTVSGTNITIGNRLASASVTGVASFGNEFVVTSGAVGLTSNYVKSVNGLTGAVVSIATTGSNTFTGLNTFNAGISASTLTVSGGVTFASDIRVNTMTIGRGNGQSPGFDSSYNTAVGFEVLKVVSPDEDFGQGIYNTGLGYRPLRSLYQGSYNTALGAYSLQSTYNGTYNTAVGSYSLSNNTSGSNNTAIGVYSISENVSGTQNVGIGYQVLKGITQSNYNTAVGYAAGYYRGSGSLFLTSATGGIYLGYQARGSTNGQTNEIVIGRDALGLGSNTTVLGATSAVSATIYGLVNAPSGISASGATFANDIRVNGVNIGLGGGNVASNLGIGKGALSGNSGGLFNTAIGSGVMEIGTNSYSVAFGYNALNSCTGGGINNVALGSSTMTTIGSASNNVAIGSNSSQNLIDGNSNISIGAGSLISNMNGSFNIAIGHQALYTNGWDLNASNNIAIGYQALYTNDDGQQNTAIGNEALRSIATTGSAERNTAIGYQAGRWRGTGTSAISNRLNTANDSIFIGWRARSSADAQTNQIVIGNNTVGGGSNTTTIGTTGTIDATIYGKLHGTNGVSGPTASFTSLTVSENTTLGNVAMTSTSSHTGLASFAGGLSAAGGITFSSNVSMTSTSSHTGLASFTGGLSASGGITFSAPITSTRMARHTSAAISAVQTVDFAPTVAQDGTVFYIDYSGKGSVTVTLDGLPIGWRAKFFNVGNGAVYFVTNGDIYGEGSVNGLTTHLMEAICIGSETYFIG